jgi:hypothetical protein
MVVLVWLLLASSLAGASLLWMIIVVSAFVAIVGFSSGVLQLQF